MMLRKGAGGLATRFAHLAGLRSSKPSAGTPKAADDEDEEKKDEATKAKAEEGDDEKKPDDDDTDEQAKAGEGDDDEGDEDEDKNEKDEAKAEARGAARERARCAAIFAAPEAGVNQPLAAHLAFETDLTVKQAVGALRAGGAAAAAGATQKRGLSERMETQPKANLGTSPPSGPDMSTPAGAAAFILGAGRAAKKEG